MEKAREASLQLNTEVVVEELIPKEYFARACSMTSGKNVPPERVDALLRKMYRAEHSPIRMRKFWIEVLGCSTFVANHFVRHNVGIEHYHLSHRSDRTGVGDNQSTRLTPTCFAMCINAQALINMARKRLCTKASFETRKVMELIKIAMEKVDPELAACMVPECEYRKGCYELSPCGKLASSVIAG